MRLILSLILFLTARGGIQRGILGFTKKVSITLNVNAIKDLMGLAI